MIGIKSAKSPLFQSRAARLVLKAALLGPLLPIMAASAPSAAEDHPAANLIEALQQRLDTGAVKLAFDDDGHSYVRDLLKALHIPRESQVLVFSASSLQFDRISQETPRAIYYQDDVVVGEVQNGRVIEMITSDAKSGVAFYTLDVTRSDKPRFERQTAVCVSCHAYASRWSAGPMVANMDTGPFGQLLNVDTRRLFRLTDDRTPFDQRYGGWYVTGDTGAMRHRGNVTLNPADSATLPAGGPNVRSLADRIDLSRYLEPGSDIVSLMTLEHQAGAINLINSLNAEYAGLDNQSLPPALRATQADVDATVEELARYLTFADAAQLPSPVKGASAFADSFPKAGVRDAQGRSLRDLDLQTRLFRYPLSYMVYSQAFDNLNPAAKARVWRRVYDILSAKDASAIEPARAAAAIAILAATKPGLPAYWRPVSSG